MTLSASALPRIYYRQSLRVRLLTILAYTQDAACAWAAYRALVVLPRSPDKHAPKVPFQHRHRLLRLLAAVPPAPLRTRGRFAQVLAVLRALHHAGGTIKTWEWNLLLDCAGKEGWRRPREEHYRAALALLAEMRRACGDDGIGGTGTTTTATSPATGERGQGWGTDDADAGDSGDSGAGASGGGAGAALALEPDIFSYTTLLAHAVRTRSPAAVRHAAQLLARAGLAPGVYAHTALLCFFAQRGDLAGVRDTLFRMRRHAHAGAGAGPGLAQVPFNAVLWAFAYNGRLDVAQAMYRVVRGRVAEGGCGRPTEADSEEREEREGLEGLENALAEREMFFISHEVVPDAATYHTLILAHAYHGDLRGCLETLTDMLSAPAPLTGTGTVPFPSPLPPLSRRLHKEDERDGQDGGGFIASLSAFRAIFLGFARHGVVEHSSISTLTLSSSSLSSSPQKNHIHLASIDNPTSLFPPASAPPLPPPSTTQKYHHRQRHHFPSSFTDHRSSHSHTTDDAPIGGESSEWTLATLEALFARFLELPRDTRLRESTLYWLVCAFARTSGRDGAVLRRMFERVEDRFTSASGLICGSSDESGRSSRQGRLARIRGRVFGS